MNERFALHDWLAQGGRGLARLGAALAEADARLERLAATGAAEPSVPAGLRALLGAAEWPDLDRGAEAAARPEPSGEARRDRAVSGMAGVTRPDSAAAAPGGPMTGHPARPVPEAGSAVRQAGGAEAAPAIRERIGSGGLGGITVSSPAAAGARQAVLPVRALASRLESPATPLHPAARVAPAAAPAPAAEARLTAVLDRIAGAGRASGPAAPLPAPRGIGVADAGMPALRAAAAAPAPAMAPPHAAGAAAPSGGLGRLIARGKAAGLVPVQAPASAAPPGAADGAHPERPPHLAMEAAAPARTGPAGAPPFPARPAGHVPFAPAADAAHLPAERLAQDLAALLRREARLAGIDIDGGAP